MKKYLIMGLLLVNIVPYINIKATETTKEPLYLVDEQAIENVRQHVPVQNDNELILSPTGEQDRQITTSSQTPGCPSNTDLNYPYLEKGLDNKDVSVINTQGDNGTVYKYYSPISSISECTSTITDTEYYKICSADQEYYFDNEQNYLEFEKQNTSSLTPEQEQANQLYLENNTK